MQAITIAIGKKGIDFFSQELVAKELINALSALTPPDRDIPFGSIMIGYSYANNIDIQLTQGKLVNFAPSFQSVSQQSGGVFPLQLTDSSFSAQYNWYETYQWISCSFIPGAGTVCQPAVNDNNTFNYTPGFSNFIVTVPLKFQYNSTTQEWEVVADTSTANPPAAQPNIPAGSIIQNEDMGCFTRHVSDATATAIASIDFNTPVSKLIKKVITGIPASGNLGNGIVYDFSLGDSGILFPNNDGIQMGVKGGASYNGKAFSGDTPPSLPLPVPPIDSDAHHLNMYVSNYEVDALNWAYYKAGELNLLLKPEDIKDPKLLHVSTYTTFAKQLAPYAPFVMFAQVTQKSAPVTSFQTVYIYSDTVMTFLQKQLPVDVYQLILGLGGNAYLSQSDVETFLQEAGVKTQYFEAIETAAKTSAMALTQDIDLSLIIQNNAAPHPDINFSVSRQDVLTDLKLGISKNNTQTMQFDIVNVNETATFENSSIPGLDGTIFGSLWTFGLAPNYAILLSNLGSTGVPLPIMEDFKFDFASAELSVQQGYVSILANVLYK